MQQAFITSKAEADLFACRMGEGKSAALVWCPWYHTQQNPGAHWAIIRDTWENLRDTTLKEFLKWFPDGVAGDFVKNTKTWTWKCEGMRGDVVFIGMDVQQDATKLQSRELAGFCIDEPAPAAVQGGVSEFIFDTAMTRLRQPGMKWYGAKLAENNPDESHWTHRRFVAPGYNGDSKVEIPKMQTHGFSFFQTARPENLDNLPPGYYENMKLRYDRAGRPDLAARFAEGEFGFQQPGEPVTPEFNRRIHVKSSLPVLDAPVVLCWDFGHNPTCLISQISPMSNWLFPEAWVGEGIGTLELIRDVIAGRLEDRFKGLPLSHTGDPAGGQRSDASIEISAVKVIKDQLGGRWRPGPKDWHARRDPAKRVLGLLRNGTGLVQIDEELAKPLWHALRGGWHYQIHSTGLVSDKPKKDIHCVDDQTEILTREGFRSVGEIREGCESWGYDLDSRKLVPDRIKHINDHRGESSLLLIENNSMSMALTPNHRSIASHGQFYHGGPVRWAGCGFIEAERLNSSYGIPHIAGEQVDKRWRVLSDPFVRLCAWVMTEGYYRKDGSREIWISQSLPAHPGYCDQIRGLVELFGGRIQVHAGKMSAIVTGDTAWMVRHLLPGKVPGREFIEALRTPERLLFLLESVKGDGIHSAGTLGVVEGSLTRKIFWKHFSGSVSLACSSDAEASAVQHLAVLSGLNSRNFGITRHHNYHRVALKRYRNYGHVGNMRRSEIKVDRVWCPTTESGTWIARRNGTIWCTGNSHPGDAFGYAAAVEFPGGERKGAKFSGGIPVRTPAYFRNARGSQPPYSDPYDDSPHDPVPPASIPAHGEPMKGMG